MIEWSTMTVTYAGKDTYAVRYLESAGLEMTIININYMQYLTISIF